MKPGEREGHLGLHASRAQYPQPALGRSFAPQAQEGGLADPGFAADEDSGTTAPDVADQLIERGDLCVPTHHPDCRHLCAPKRPLRSTAARCAVAASTQD